MRKTSKEDDKIRQRLYMEEKEELKNNRYKRLLNKDPWKLTENELNWLLNEMEKRKYKSKIIEEIRSKN